MLFLPRLQTKPLNIVDMLAGSDNSDEDSDGAEEKRSFDIRKWKTNISIALINHIIYR